MGVVGSWRGRVSGFTTFSENEIVEPPVAAFQLSGCAMWFINLISRALDGEGIPCPSLWEIGSDSQQTLKSFAQFVSGRELLVGDRVRSVRTN